MQDGDVVSTFTDASGLIKIFNYSSDTKLSDGTDKFVKWYRKFYKGKSE